MISRGCYISKRFFGIVNKDAQKKRVWVETKNYRISNPMWGDKDPEKITIEHHQPKGVRDWVAYGLLNSIIRMFDVLSGFQPNNMTEKKWGRHFLFMESISGVPRVIASFVRHLKAIFYKQHDSGAYHHLIQEEENERMHLFLWLTITNAGIFVKTSIALYQVFFAFFFGTMYTLSPRVGHRFLGYLEENIIRSYTLLIRDLEEGKLPNWKTMREPKILFEYYELPEDKVFRDLILEVRADEVLHREVNHLMAEVPMKEEVEDKKK